MKSSQENAKKNSEKGVSFGALETIDRHSDSMDKLASLVSKLDMNWTNGKPNIGHKSIKLKIEVTDKDRIVTGPGIDPTVGTMVNTTIKEGEIITIIIVITEIIVGLETETVMEMAIEEMIGMIVDQTIGEMMVLITGKIMEGIIIGKIMGTKGTEIEV